MAITASRDMIILPARLPVGVTSMQAMASKIWKPFIAMGFMMVVAAFIIGLVNSFVAGDYYAATKAVREAAEGGSKFRRRG